MVSSTALVSAWPKWSLPVTFGGGMTIMKMLSFEDLSFKAALKKRKWLFICLFYSSSQNKTNNKINLRISKIVLVGLRTKTIGKNKVA